MSSSTAKVCFNSNCRETSENWRRGWRRRTGDCAHLCDRCASAYEDGKFCETFHSNDSGWRCCETCGKQIHCGCIVSFHMFVLLDEGGIECLSCAKKSFILTPNPAWPRPSHFLPSQSETMTDFSVKTWNSVAGACPGPVPWRQAPSLFSSDVQSNVHQRMSSEADLSGRIDRYHICDRSSTASPDMKRHHTHERLVPGKLRFGPSEMSQNGNSGINMKEQSYPFVNDFKPVFLKHDSSTSNLSSAAASSSRIETDDAQHSVIVSQPPATSVPIGKLINLNGMESSGQAQTRNGKVRGDTRGRNQLLPRYRPQITDEELQQISSNSKSVTPLFEKMLSASDAGRIGRLVLPKKCAEAYFPAIAQPEGLPLRVQDVKGKEWVFQFRYWPNNNSRMYVLEGITPCIQSMQLQAGDVVTFSRLEPEGKLVMGGRKASAVPSSDQRDETMLLGSDSSTPGDGVARNKSGNAVSVNGYMKEKILDDQSIYGKRKNGSFGVKNKRLKLDNDNVIEVKLTWKEAQRLMRPPAKIIPSLFVVEGCEFEEFEEAAPIIGRPTIPGVDHLGEKIQWVQCEDCFKWRKVPADALLPSRWICAENVWDDDRSLCSATEELTKDLLEHLLHDSFEKEEVVEQDADMSVALEVLDRLANLAVLEEGEGEGLSSASQNSSKHLRHRSGCTCIVCLQPPGGKGSRHNQSCDCALCGSLRRRFKTLMERQEKKQSEKEPEPSSQELQWQQTPKKEKEQSEKGPECSSQELQWQQTPKKVQEVDIYPGTNSLNQEEASKCKTTCTSPLKGQIDLNIQPEREEESSPGSDSVQKKCLLPGSEDRIFETNKSLESAAVGGSVEKQMQKEEMGGTNFTSCVALDDSSKKTA